MTQLNKFYVTYGCGTNLAGCFSVVEAADYQSARVKIHTAIDPAFAFCYDEEEFAGQQELYGLTEVPLQAQFDLDGVESW